MFPPWSPASGGVGGVAEAPKSSRLRFFSGMLLTSMWGAEEVQKDASHGTDISILTFTIYTALKTNHSCIGKYISPMDGLGYIIHHSRSVNCKSPNQYFKVQVSSSKNWAEMEPVMVYSQQHDSLSWEFSADFSHFRKKYPCFFV